LKAPCYNYLNNFHFEAMRRSESKYSFDLTLYLRGVKRFEGEFKDAGADINRRWKYSSPTKEIPEP
jgi:hypothetical protein